MTTRIETRQVHVVYCDNCGEEITGNYTIFNHFGESFDACDKWHDDVDKNCARIFSDLLATRALEERKKRSE